MRSSTPKESVTDGKEFIKSCATGQQNSEVRSSQRKSVKQSVKNKSAQCTRATTPEKDPSTFETSEWHPIRHPKMTISTPPRYFVNKNGVLSSFYKEKCRVLKQIKGSNAYHSLCNGKGEVSTFKLDEIMVYTFSDLQFDSDKHYIFHKDGDQKNCAWDNLVVCDTLTALQHLEIARLENQNPGTKYIVVRNVHNTFTFERYLVSDAGKVYSLRTRRHLQPCKKEAYLVVMLCSDSNTPQTKARWAIPVHTIVMRSFRGPQANDCIVNYINGDRYDLSLKNLEYAGLSQVMTRALQPVHVQARRLREERGDVLKKDALRPLVPVNEETRWKYINVLPWNGRSYSEYQVSNMGHIRTVGDRPSPPLYIRRGYVCVNMRRDMPVSKKECPETVGATAYRENVSRLVALAFVDGYSETHNFVKHLNGDKQDNRADNLEWVDRKINITNRRSRLVVASLVDDPNWTKEFDSIVKAEHMLCISNISRYDAKNGGRPFVREVTWEGMKEMALIRVFESECQSFNRL